MSPINNNTPPIFAQQWQQDDPNSMANSSSYNSHSSPTSQLLSSFEDLLAVAGLDSPMEPTASDASTDQFSESGESENPIMQLIEILASVAKMIEQLMAKMGEDGEAENSSPANPSDSEKGVRPTLTPPPPPNFPSEESTLTPPPPPNFSGDGASASIDSDLGDSEKGVRPTLTPPPPPNFPSEESTLTPPPPPNFPDDGPVSSPVPIELFPIDADDQPNIARSLLGTDADWDGGAPGMEGARGPLEIDPGSSVGAPGMEGATAADNDQSFYSWFKGEHGDLNEDGELNTNDVIKWLRNDPDFEAGHSAPTITYQNS